jgi:membrane-bound lytic murein transglycosylase D
MKQWLWYILVIIVVFFICSGGYTEQKQAKTLQVSFLNSDRSNGDMLIPIDGDQSSSDSILSNDEEDTVDDESADLSVAHSSDTFLIEQKELLKKVQEAQALYEAAQQSFQYGNNAKAKEYYSQSLERLSVAAINPEINFLLKDEFDSVFSKLNTILNHPSVSAGTFKIPMDTENELVKKYLKLYTEGECRERIQKALERSGKYRPMILKILKEYNLPEELVYLPIVESLYNAYDVSHAGAVGIWQLMPELSRGMGLKINYWIDERRDPEKSTRVAARYLKELYFLFDDWHMALAAYNRGENGLIRDLKFSNATNITELSKRKAVPLETERYVPQFIACSLIGANPEKYGFNVQYEKPIDVDTVTVNNIIDLKVVAKCAGISVETLRSLNPALKAWCTPYNYAKFHLKLPAGTGEVFAANIVQEKDLNPSSGFIRYRVSRGDSLVKIAKKFDTTIRAIMEDNHMKARRVKVKQLLVIRPGKKYSDD